MLGCKRCNDRWIVRCMFSTVVIKCDCVKHQDSMDVKTEPFRIRFSVHARPIIASTSPTGFIYDDIFAPTNAEPCEWED